MNTNIDSGNVPQEHNLAVCQLSTCRETKVHGHNDGGWMVLPRVNKTIDSKGNIMPKPYGGSRWASPKNYNCNHEDGCLNPATVLNAIPSVHNCCNQHEHREGESL
jgi:hypothetical protein